MSATMDTIQQSKRTRVVRAFRRLFRRTHQAPVISAGVRMSLALAIAEQYVLVSQDWPAEQESPTVCDTVVASPVSGYKPMCCDEATLASERRVRKSFIRPRTASASTVCESKCVNACCSMVASRENPLCC
ncbi:hypothetical protein GGH19_005219 [Coemansia sp. RSA 1807]|nr:hypothetical protein LPJ62_002360 [Coemansia sp. RSA 2167]KAJ2126548.1 hypothetical protein GGH17_005003 [Coemansia sp. RSA 788]KAJ2146942.1 hypothetical protein IW142_001831 [Coemansia sp. RSA 564]KAJ2163058.1 hypothetical protein GGH15_004601 [Coemansia sp. RSA 562]KAJ2166827.1 hypothetical protein GGH16_004037 [Coemansia sp. RSA 560]KAJ2190753.1 hypothetical protein EV181_000811 [Coemansia sp. RSA 532]KAJ2192576.1 hypothetical protein IW144_004821 [Coemansia sp. RSA 522]KAJ2210664.1 hy